MAHELTFYFKKQFPHLKEKYVQMGYRINSISKYKNSNDAEETEEKCLVDISSLHGILSQQGMQYNFENLFESFPENSIFICDVDYREEIEYDLRYCFEKISLYEHDMNEENQLKNRDNEPEKKCVNKIIDLNGNEFEVFIDKFEKSLYGHEKFKDDFKEVIDLFKIFNSIGEHKILSLFLMGNSGVGKTEVARSLHKALNSKKRLAKINFGNYSSKDALNNLIGSPRGYIGSEGGELFIKVLDSDVGVILIDEFEKADTAVFNYFLDVLETGIASNSLGEEIDLSGYIIVFTSNIEPNKFESFFSPELRSRFDYIGSFEMLTTEDKDKYVKYRLSDIILKYEKKIKHKLPEDIHSKLRQEINVDNYENMRLLNNQIKKVFVAYVNSQKE